MKPFGARRATSSPGLKLGASVAAKEKGLSVKRPSAVGGRQSGRWGIGYRVEPYDTRYPRPSSVRRRREVLHHVQHRLHLLLLLRGKVLVVLQHPLVAGTPHREAQMAVLGRVAL